jgi:hypothetical protein
MPVAARLSGAQHYPVPHVSDTVKRERIERVKGMLDEAGVIPPKPGIVIDFEAMDQEKQT